MQVMQPEMYQVGAMVDGGWLFIDVDDAANDGRIAAEAALPETVTDYDGRRRGRIAVALGFEEAADGCGRSQFGEVVGRDEGRRCLLNIVVDLHGRHAQHAHDRRQRHCIFLVEEER